MCECAYWYGSLFVMMKHHKLWSTNSGLPLPNNTLGYCVMLLCFCRTTFSKSLHKSTALPHHLQYQEFQVQSYLMNQEVVPVDNTKIELNYLIHGIFSCFVTGITIKCQYNKHSYCFKQQCLMRAQSTQLTNHGEQQQNYLTIKSVEWWFGMK